ncbi:MAG: 3-keto-disaccharide hydrolase [Marinirhabdus sp.]
MAATALFFSCEENKEPTNMPQTETGATAQETKRLEPTKPEATEVWGPKPVKVDPTAKNGAPNDATVLFDGSNLDAWVSSKDGTSPSEWSVNEDGSMTVKDKSGNIQTKENFGSVQLHIEWRSNPENKQTNQNRSNSGVFLQKKYEVQVLDNNDNDTYVNGMVGSVYKQSPPLVNPAKPTGQWNAYDIVFHAPEFDTNGNKTKPGTLTVLFNGVLVQDHFELEGTTEYIGWPKNEAHGPLPIMLQDHQDMSGVSYRNIWVRKL